MMGARRSVRMENVGLEAVQEALEQRGLGGGARALCDAAVRRCGPVGTACAVCSLPSCSAAAARNPCLAAMRLRRRTAAGLAHAGCRAQSERFAVRAINSSVSAYG